MNKRDADRVNKALQTLYEVCEKARKTRSGMETSQAEGGTRSGLLWEVRKEITDAATNIRNNNLPRKCNKENCSKCHLNHLCLSKTEKKQYAI